MARRFRAERNIPDADVRDVADHIDHVVELVGVDDVGLGSDFDSVGDSLPTGLKDISQYPSLVGELLRRGYDDESIEKIPGGNVLRMWSDVEAVVRTLPAVPESKDRAKEKRS